MADEWESFYGLKGGYSGKGTDRFGKTIDYMKTGTGFGAGDYRKARLEGYSATSIHDFLKGQGGGGTVDNLEQTGAHKSNIGYTAWNDVISDMKTEQALKKSWESWNEKFGEYTKTADQVSPDLSGYATTESLGDYAKTESLGDYAKTADVTKNAEDIALAMKEAQKVRQNNPYAVTGNAVMGIQQQQSPGQVAGQISAGLAGFSRNRKKFQNKTLNV